MGQHESNNRNSNQFTGTDRESRLKRDERIARNHEFTWLSVFLVILLVSACFLFTGLINQEINYSIWVIVPLSLIISITRYDKFCKERKSIGDRIQAYYQIEAGGTLKKSAQIGLQQFYEQNHDPPPRKNVIIELLNRRNKDEN